MRFYLRAPVDNPHRLSEDAPVIHRRKGRFVKLYMVPLAPNPTKVMLYIAEREALGTALPIEQIVVNTLKGRHREPEHIARNPFGTLPVLELDDGSLLTVYYQKPTHVDEKCSLLWSRWKLPE